jgi:hypothetical protein
MMVVELVRRRKLKEEYSVLWVGTAAVVLLFSIWFSLLKGITDAIGAISPASTLFFFGLLFVMAMLLHFSIRTSQLERRLTALIQEIGLLSAQHPHRDGVDEDAADDEPLEGDELVPRVEQAADEPRVRA